MTFLFRIQVIVQGEYNYADPLIQHQVETLTQTFENTSYISSNPLYTESWLRRFVNYVENNGDYLNISIKTPQDFLKNLKEVSRCVYLIVIWHRRQRRY